MGIIAETEPFKADAAGVEYKVKILCYDYLDSSLIPANGTAKINLAPPFFKIDWEPDVDDVASPIVPSNCEVSIYDDRRGGRAQEFFEDKLPKFLEYQDDQLFLQIVTTHEAREKPVWEGVIVTDQIAFPLDFLGTVTIRATDGIRFLKDIDFPLYNTEVGHSKIPELIGRIIEFIPTYATYPMNFKIATDFFPVEFLNDSSALMDMLWERLLYDAQALYKEDEKNDAGDIVERNPFTCYEVLKQFALVFFCRFYQSWDSDTGAAAWWFDHVYSFDPDLQNPNSNIINVDGEVGRKHIWTYGKIGGFHYPYLKNYKSDVIARTILRVPGQSSVGSVEPFRDAYVMRGAKYIAQPAATAVKVSQKPWQEDEALLKTLQLGEGTGNTNDPNYAEDNLLLLDKTVNGEGQRVNLEFAAIRSSFQARFKNIPKNDYPGIGGLRARKYYLFSKFRLVIKLTSVETNNTFYYNIGSNQWLNNYNINLVLVNAGYLYTEVVGGGSDDAGTLKKGFRHGGGPNHLKTLVQTAPLPEDGRIGIEVTYFGYRESESFAPNNIGFLDRAEIVYDNTYFEVKFSTKLDQTKSTEIFNLDNNDPNIKGKNVVDLGTTQVGDGKLQTGSITYRDTENTIRTTTQWQVGKNARASDYPVLRLLPLLCNQRMEFQAKGLKIFNAGAVALPYYSNRFVIQGVNETLMPMRMSYRAQGNEIEGQFAKVNESNFLFPTPVFAANPGIPGTGFMNGNTPIDMNPPDQVRLRPGLEGLYLDDVKVNPFYQIDDGNGGKLWTITDPNDFTVDITPLQDDVTTLQGDLDSFYDTVNDEFGIVDSQITSLETDVTTLQSNMTDAFNSIQNLSENDVNTNSANITQLQGDVTNLQENVAFLVDRGQRPIQMFSGSGPPSSSTVKDVNGSSVTPVAGDTYFNSNNGNFYRYNGETWVLLTFEPG